MATATQRQVPEVFRLPVEKIRSGYCSDSYFVLTKELLEAEGRHPRVTMQVFAKRKGLLGGIDESIAILQTGDGWAAHGAGAIGVSTDAQASWWGGRGVGTVPHGLIAAYDGDTVAAARDFAARFGERINVVELDGRPGGKADRELRPNPRLAR
jgi:nicotinic acid phosphoribosyltransferase